MPTINKVILIGNLTRDPEMKYLPSGTGTCQIALALNRSYKDAQGVQHDDVTFVNIDFWEKTAELVAQYCRKGHALYVEGHLKVDSWQDKDSGANRTMLKVVGDSIQFLTSKKSGDESRDEAPDRTYRDEAPARHEAQPARQYRDEAPPARREAPPARQYRDEAPPARREAPPARQYRDEAPPARREDPPARQYRDEAPPARREDPPARQYHDEAPPARRDAPPARQYRDEAPPARRDAPPARSQTQAPTAYEDDDIPF